MPATEPSTPPLSAAKAAPTISPHMLVERGRRAVLPGRPNVARIIEVHHEATAMEPLLIVSGLISCPTDKPLLKFAKIPSLAVTLKHFLSINRIILV